jgi:TRAP-type C4-dicarboxylate transport system substrate-binding protein
MNSQQLEELNEKIRKMNAEIAESEGQYEAAMKPLRDEWLKHVEKLGDQAIKKWDTYYTAMIREADIQRAVVKKIRAKYGF